MPLPLIPILGGKLLSANQNLIAQQQEMAGESAQNSIENILNARGEREQARNNYTPPGRIGMNGMSLPGESMQKQEQLFQGILNKYGAGSWQGTKGGMY